MGAEVLVRPIEAKDQSTWRSLWDAYCTFYEANVSDEVSKATYERLIDQGVPNMFGLVAEVDGSVIGFTNCVIHPNTWSTKGICYLEDLFVSAEVRGGGAGRALIDAVTSMGKAFGWQRIYWRTGAENAQAQVLYNKLAKRTDWITYEVEL